MSDGPTIFHGDVSIVANNNDTVLYGLGRLNVEYDTIIGGILSQLNSTNFVIRDNLPVVNFGSTTNGRDIGIMGSRTLSDVLNDAATESGTASSGTVGTITLDAGSSTVDDAYNGYILAITSGTGIGQTRDIVDYVGSTKIATVSSNWAF